MMFNEYGERSLWAAVLHLAVLDFKSGRGANHSAAYRWIISDATEPTSFIWVCGVLSFDHLVIRKKILQDG